MFGKQVIFFLKLLPSAICFDFRREFIERLRMVVLMGGLHVERVIKRARRKEFLEEEKFITLMEWRRDGGAGPLDPDDIRAMQEMEDMLIQDNNQLLEQNAMDNNDDNNLAMNVQVENVL